MIWELCTAQMLYRDWDSRLNILDRACSEFPHCTGSAVPGCWSARMQFILSWLVNCTIVMLISFLCLGAWILTAKNTCLVSSIEITYIYLVNHLIEIKNWHSYKKTASFTNSRIPTNLELLHTSKETEYCLSFGTHLVWIIILLYLVKVTDMINYHELTTNMQRDLNISVDVTIDRFKKCICIDTFNICIITFT